MASRAALIGSLLLSGCGLADAPSLEPLVDPGKGAFHEEGAIEVCLGKTRVDGRDEAGASLGLCVAPGVAERTCDDGGGCGLGERCLCGRCSLAACREGRPCEGGALCRSGLCVTPCKGDQGCKAGEVCSSGGCSRPCQPGGDCGFGGRCDLLSGVCRVDLCGDDAGCGAGRSCVIVETSLGLREPAWLPGGGALVEVREPSGGVTIREATIEGPTRWRLAEAPVLPAGAARAPSPLVVGGSIEALFTEEDGQITVRRATGSMLFGPPEVALSPREPWEQGRAGSPAAVEFQGQRWLIYEVGQRAGLGLATLDAGGKATSRRLLLAPSDVEQPGRWAGVEAVGAPDAVVNAGLLLVYFTGRGVEGGPAQQGSEVLPAESNDSLGLLASLDGVHFDLAPGPIVARRSNLRTYLGERESALRVSGGGAELLFVASDAAGSVAGLGLLRSP